MSRFNYKANSSFNDSDISEADDSDIAKILKETQDLDGDVKKPPKPNFSQTMPSSLKTNPIIQKNKSFNFDDDPLENLDDLISNKKQTNTSSKPPLASTMPAPAKPKNLFSFDNEDLNFDLKPKASQPKVPETTSKQDTLLFDELFGKPNQERSEMKTSQEAVKTNDDDNFLFGGYTPSAATATTTPRFGLNTAPPKRSVSFNYDDDLLSKPKVESANLNKTQSIINKLESEIDFENILKPKTKTAAKPDVKIEDYSKEALKLETSFDLDVSFSNTKRRGSHGGLAEKPPVGLKMAKDSVNSSFADSIENADHNPPQKSFTLNNIQPIGFENKSEDKKDGEWLNLITNRKPVNQNLSKKQMNEIPNVEHGGENSNLVQKIKHLEYENQDLKLRLEHDKSNYELQLKLVKESSENQVEMLKKDRENSIRLFKEEKEILSNRIDLIEKEKLDLSTVYKQKLDDKQKEFDMEVEKLKKFHRIAIENLKEENEQVVERIKRLKENEINAAIAANSHTKTLESVINLIEDNTKNLDNISHKVQMSHMVNMNEHELQIRNKEEQLKLQEQRLSRQQKDYENEIRNLNETIQRLENHLAEQSKMVAEERWKGKQQEKKMEAFQEALINEQKIIMEKLARERGDIERSKDEMLLEQKRLMQQIYEEKRKIAEDRADLEAKLTAYKDKQHKDSLSNINIEAEISVSTRRIQEEKERLEKIKTELKEKEIEIRQEKKALDEKKAELESKMIKLDQLQAVLNQKYSDAEELYTKSNREKENNRRILDEVSNIKMSHDSRLNQIQQQLLVLSERETQINQEKIALYKLQQDIEVYKSNLTCSKCKEPVKDSSFLGISTAQTSGYSSGFVNLYQSRLNSTMISNINNSILEDSKLLRQLKIQAFKDKQFVNEEKNFIESIKNNSRSASMNQLNSTLS